jgi:hypothetical protein
MGLRNPELRITVLAKASRNLFEIMPENGKRQNEHSRDGGLARSVWQ